MKDIISSVKCLLEEFISKAWQGGGYSLVFFEMGKLSGKKKDDCVR